MSLNNLNNVHLTDQQIAAVNKALTDLETALRPININLSPEDRNKYGRVNEQNKLFINKVNDFATSQPDLRSPDVEWAEFAKDYKSRNLYENIINRLDNLQLRLKSAKILHDYDNYQDALDDYAYTQYKAGTRAINYEDKLRELKQFFTQRRKKDTPKDSDQPTTDQ